MPHRLGSIGMKNDTFQLGKGADFLDRLYGTDFVVGKHYWDQDGFLLDGLFQDFEINNTIAVHRQ